jgi:amino acid adenylation domain-containing protein
MIKRKIEAVYALSPLQEGMLFHSVFAPRSGVYIEQLCCTLRGALDVLSFARAWQQVVERHAILRTAFSWKSLDKMLQVVNRQVEIPIEEQDWRKLSATEQSARLRAFLKADRERGFDLSKAPLLRLALFRTGEEAYQFVWTYHHILLDGWSLPILFKEVFSFYECFSAGQSLQLESPRPYRDYIAWLQQRSNAEAEAFWRGALKGFTAPTPLVVDCASPEVGYEALETRLSKEQTAQLHSLARSAQLTLNTLLQGAWALLLSRYSNQEDVLFGVTVSGRPAELVGVESMVGLFINTLPMRVRVRPQASALSWLKELQAQQAEMRQYEYSSLVQIQGWSEVARGVPLFESLLVFENYPVEASLHKQQWSLRVEAAQFLEQVNYPLTVISGPGDELALKILYDRSRFDAETIGRMLGHLRTLLEAIAASPDRPISTLPLLAEAERLKLLLEWNETAASFPRSALVHQLFEAQAAARPDSLAIASTGGQLSYRELNERANKLAHYLRKLGIGPETLVGICVERSPEMVVALLAILKAGGAYVPLDPAYPKERLAWMLADTQAPVLLTQTHLLNRLPAHQARIVCLDSDWEKIAAERVANPINIVSAENLAYCIYTSGSTGRPKGVEIEHGNLLNLIFWHQRTYAVSAADRATQLASLGFDASVWELWPYLTAGASLHLVDDETRGNPARLKEWLLSQQITISFLPTPLAAEVLALEWPAKVALRKLLTGGDKLHHYPPPCLPFEVWNNYGPTENTVVATYCLVPPDKQTVAAPPIGRPIANTQVYILDAHLQPVPVGVPGELYIGGASLARGYLNQPALTEEKFIRLQLEVHNTAQVGARSKVEVRVYKTGDLARYLPDGSIEFLGRIDDQVKLRGFRIEPGEIESALREHPEVREAVVVAREDAAGEKRLVAYLVTTTPMQHSDRSKAQPTDAQMRSFLRQKLPEYMLPSAFVMLDQLPLTPHGKVDRRALAALEGARSELEAAYIAPRTPIEELLAELWAKVLGLERVGIHDNFFALGGHSLLATQMLARLNEACKVELPLRSLFEKPTIAELAREIEELIRNAPSLTAPPIRPVPRSEELPLSFAQQRLWFLDQLEVGSPFYNNPAAVRITGQLDVAALERSLNEIARRHEILRTSFATLDGKPVQVIASSLKLALPVVDLRHLPAHEREQEARRVMKEAAQQPFDLANGPLARLCLWRLNEEEYVALLVLHHIVSDGWSNGVLIRELATLYQAFSNGYDSPLPELKIQYADFAYWQRKWLQGEALTKQLTYWKEQLSGSPPLLQLPTDHPRPAVQSFRGAHHRFTFSAELTEKLKALSRQESVTLFMTLLAAFQTLLYRYSGQEDICVGTPIAGRNRAEIEDLIGFFVNTLVMRTDLAGDPGFRELLKRVREVALGAYTHQDVPFEMLVEELRPVRELSHTPLFQVMLGLNNTPATAIELPGLSFHPIEVESGTARCDLLLELTERPEGLSGLLEYNTSLFEPATIARMSGHFQRLLEAVVADPAQRLSRLPLLTDTELKQLLIEWNQTEADYPHDQCIHHMFEAQVEKQPEALAVAFEKEQLTYQELNRRANQLAHYLRKLDVGPEKLVGICTERSIEMIVALLGVLKAEGAYLPLDPTYPTERLAFMLSDAQVVVLLTQKHLLDRLPPHPAQAIRQVICLDADWEQIARESDQNPSSSVTPENLAYCIYTSGSTGRPKGVLIPHRGLCSLAMVHRRVFGVDSSSRILQFAPFSFDVSVWETFMALVNGATLCLARQERLSSMDELHHLLQEQQITTLTLPPSVLSVLSAEGLPALKTVISGSEKCPKEVVKRWAPGRGFFNAYGPTETTICSSIAPCDESLTADPPIGRPLANTQFYILDRHLQPVPVGVPGELHIGGIGVARAYLNRPELTAKKFIQLRIEKAESDSELLVYKTGDLVRYRSDGNVEFLGRIDHQVKLRGFRIELGEIESVLEQHPAVREAAVIVREEGGRDKRLVAYVVAEEEGALEAGELKRFLRSQLPEYMIPAAFVELKALPLLPNGKLDRAALPALDGVRLGLAPQYTAPRTEIEERLAAIWAELLKVDRIGVYDNFFELGGHSLLATQLVSRVRQAFGVELSLVSLFERPVIAALAEIISQGQLTGQEQDGLKIERASRGGQSIEELLAELEQLSDEEAQTLLAEKTNALFGSDPAKSQVI